MTEYLERVSRKGARSNRDPPNYSPKSKEDPDETSVRHCSPTNDPTERNDAASLQVTDDRAAHGSSFIHNEELR